MAETPRTIVVQLDIRGFDEELRQLLRRAACRRAPQPPRRGLRARLARWYRGRA